MIRSHARRAVLTLGLLMALVAPATASAWTVTVHVHGAGLVDEVTARNLMHCTVGPTDKSEATVTDCVAGTPGGHYSSFDIVELSALVPADHFSRGWRFSHWQDSTAGGGKIDCDPTGGPGQPPANNCRFQIFENLEVDLYFDDVEGPQDTTIVSGPASMVRTNSTSAAFTFNSPSEPSDARYECMLDRPGQAGEYYDCGTSSDKGESYSNLTANGQYAFFVRAKDPTGNVDNTPVLRSWFVDTIAPIASIAGGPANGSTTSSRSAAFTVGAGESGATVACTLDTVSVPCGTSFGNLAEGQHTFSARSTDQAGNVGPTISRTWFVDSVAPTVTLVGGPDEGSHTSSRALTIGVVASEPGTTLTCALDGSPLPSCDSPVANLADGPHTFSARATDAAGNVGPAVTRAWTVDTVAPTASITGEPADGARTNDPTPDLVGSASDGTLVCRIDGDAAPCTFTASLAEGEHTFTATATDAAGNVHVATRTWTVDVTPPVITITSGPAEGSTVSDSSPAFAFSADEDGSFKCSLDMAALAPCSSLTGLSDGPHSLRVEFTDTAGNKTTVERKWTIDTTGPETTIESGPAEGSTSAASDVTFSFGSPEAGATFECRLDGAAFAACPTPLKLTGLADGDHVFEVRARDGLGNADASPARRAFRVDTSPGNPPVQPPVTPVTPVTPGQPGVVSAVLGKRFKVAGARTRILRLTVSKIAVGAKVKIVCKGRGCPIRSKTLAPSSGVVNVRNVLKRRPLRAGTTLTITVSQPGMTSKVFRLKFRRGKAPTGP